MNEKASKLPHPQRRLVLSGFAAGVGGFYIGKARAAERITVRDAGGAAAEVYKKAYYEPFTKETGIEVVSVSSMPDPVAQIKAVVETRSYTWDMVIQPKSVVLGADAYIEELGSDVLNDANVKAIPSRFKSTKLVGTTAYASALVYRTDKMAHGPSSWADFYDVRKFPGRRALRKAPLDTIEQALLADGVKPADLYPCDLDRAFRKLDSIKRNIAVWWASGAQASQMIKTGEVDMLSAWHTRAVAAINDGAPAQIVWNEGLYTFEGCAILKGTPRAALCRELVKFCARPDRQALMEVLSIGPTNPDAYKYIPKERVSQLATAPEITRQMIQINEEYWAKARSTAVERFNSWLLA